MRLLKWVWGLLALVAVLLVTVGSLVIAIISIYTSRGIAGCVNNALGDRNGVSASDAAAHVGYAVAEKAYAHALNAVLAAPQDSDRQKQAYRVFLRVAREKQAADDRYVATLQANQRYRNARPLGEC